MNLPHRRLMVACEHDFTRIGMVSFLQSSARLHIVGEARNGLDALTLARTQKPDIAILDNFLPGLNSLELTCGIWTELPHTHVLMFIAHEHTEMLVEIWSASANGNVLFARTGRQLVEAVEALSMGHPHISEYVTNDAPKPRWQRN